LKGEHLAIRAIAKVRILLVFCNGRQYNFYKNGNFSA